MTTTLSALMKEFRTRANGVGLECDCLMDGSVKASIAIIGEAPNQQEAAHKLPLSSGAGRLLWQMLNKHNINRTTTYTTYAVKRKIGFNQQINKRELTHWAEMLKWELSQLPNLTHVLVLGSVSLQALFNERAIDQWRGNIAELQLEGRTVLCLTTHAPSTMFAQPLTKPIVKFDLNKFHVLVRDGWKKEALTTHINPSYNDALRWIDKMHDECKPISLDIETIAGQTACVGLGNSINEAMCINWRDARHNRFTLTEERRLLVRLHRLLSHNKTRLVMQNGHYDTTWLAYKDRVFAARVWFDTLLAHHCIYAEFPHNLGFLTAQYTMQPYYKNERTQWREDGDINAFWEYNCKDVCITLMVQQKLELELRAVGLYDFFMNHVMRIAPHLARMTTQGCLIDTTLKQQLVDVLSEDVANKRALFQQAVEAAYQKYLPGQEPPAVNPASPKQLKELFFTSLKLIGNGTTTNAENRMAILNHKDTCDTKAAVLYALNEWAAENKFFSTYAKAKVDDDGWMRYDYKQFGVQSAPGRLSSSSTGWETGMNMQNQPRRAQSMYVAPEGYAFVYFDLAQAEARVVGWLACIQKWVDDFERARTEGGFDCHRSLAADMFEVAYADVPKYDLDDNNKPSMRYIAKRCRHGLNYRMFWLRLAVVTGLPRHQAKDAYDRYHAINPELRRWWDNLEQEVRATKRLDNCFGRSLRFFSDISDDTLKASVAFKPQSTIGDKVAITIPQCHEDDDWPMHSRCVFNVHDALIALSRVEDVMQTARVMKKHAEAPIDVYRAVEHYLPAHEALAAFDPPPLIVPADFKVSYPTSWEYVDDTLVFNEDAKGQHRWSHMKGLTVD